MMIAAAVLDHASNSDAVFVAKCSDAWMLFEVGFARGDLHEKAMGSAWRI